ncbi:MAG: ATP synthase F1 subunit delta [Acidimicrobiia bacterium]|nr:ATP synthase F1 subunit delta [Acidimicrobiia bacterium]
MRDAAIRGYAQAMLDVADAEGVLADVEDELFAFRGVLEANPDLVQGLSDVGIPAERRQQLVEELLGGRALPQTVQLVSFVVGGGRGRVLQDVIIEFLELAASRKSSAVAEVRSASQLSDDQKSKLAAALEKATGKKVQIRVQVDPSVIGGVLVKVGDQIVDGTVRTQLNRFREGLRSAS